MNQFYCVAASFFSLSECEAWINQKHSEGYSLFHVFFNGTGEYHIFMTIQLGHGNN